jgi:hypothetical protein
MDDGYIKSGKIINLPDWWVCAGFVRSKIWDTLQGFKERTPIQILMLSILMIPIWKN